MTKTKKMIKTKTLKTKVVKATIIRRGKQVQSMLNGVNGCTRDSGNVDPKGAPLISD